MLSSMLILLMVCCGDRNTSSMRCNLCLHAISRFQFCEVWEVKVLQVMVKIVQDEDCQEQESTDYPHIFCILRGLVVGRGRAGVLT